MTVCRPKLWKYLSITLSFVLAAQLLSGAFSRKFDPLAYVMSVHQRIPWKIWNESLQASSETYQMGNGAETSAQEGTQDSSLLSKEKPLCPPVPPYLAGRLTINRTAPSLEELERTHPELEPGGRYRPAECRARHRVAIVIPYRDRAQHLSVFLFHMHPVLQRQQLDYDIYIIEQAGSGKFNRAMLMNVGALESLKQYPYDCFIFHDIDLLPEDDRNLYTCPEQPRHMSIAVDTLNYKLPYENIFGGVSALTVDQFKQVNGFSNSFWGWGGEDDDMSHRVRYYGFFLSRYPAHIGRYTMLSHNKDAPNPERFDKLYNGEKRFKTDGINSIKYKVLDIQLRRLFTWVHVELYPS
ncbi:beta-1,4-N-acetylgalactosaminyltransferase bre-4-like [Macrobrachium nipponense]|uniref:beta-1,4-N-acetylgalactosaminyltransferase bre-4-like n=1 Tax=Macrobrachium nipponense TaxID=159736 RepID=UPI0030C7EBA2